MNPISAYIKCDDPSYNGFDPLHEKKNTLHSYVSETAGSTKLTLD